MKIDNTIEQVRESSQKLIGSNNAGRVPVIVLTPYTKRKAYYGLQFWTPEMILTGTSSNTDGTVSTFQENL